LHELAFSIQESQPELQEKILEYFETEMTNSDNSPEGEEKKERLV